MSGQLNGLLAALVLLVSVGVVAPGVAGAGTLDQQHTGSVVGRAPIFGEASQAQTFTAGLSGHLDQVDLFLDDNSGPPATVGPLTVEIRNAVGDAPGSTVLAARTLQVTDVPTTPAFVPVVFAAPAGVSAGTQYAIVAHTGDAYSWGITPTPYPGGRSCVASSSPPTTAWECTVSGDVVFKTYVKQPARLSATPAVVRLSGLKLYLYNLNATLTTTAGAPLAGKPITFRAGSTTLCTANTDAAGVARCNALSSLLQVTLAFGYSATFAGDTSHGTSSATAGLIAS
jgi:hypothetical protein